jgi:glycosyltransferase involved in cell wall biosynthesis
MIESLACGTPVVSMDVCSAREVLEEHGVGFVVPAGDHAALLERVAELAAQPALRQKMAARAVEVARNLFRSDRNVLAYETIYLELAAQLPAAARL